MLHSQSQLLQEPEAAQMYRVLDNVADCQPPVSWLAICYGQSKFKQEFLFLYIFFQKINPQAKAAVLENVWGFKRVMAEFNELVEQKLPEYLGSK